MTAVLNPALAIALLVVLSWLQHRKCECKDRPTILKPRWKRYGRK